MEPEWTGMALEWTKMDTLEPNLHKYTIFGNWSCDHHPYIALKCNLTKKMLIFMTFSEMQVFPYLEMHT